LELLRLAKRVDFSDSLPLCNQIENAYEYDFTAQKLPLAYFKILG
jgi:hypothetical protein